MTAPPTSPTKATANLNHLRRGMAYRATTRHGTTLGEYLGMETPHGQRAILLRNEAGTESITLTEVISIEPAAA